jgi:hypothetical protein
MRIQVSRTFAGTIILKCLWKIPFSQEIAEGYSRGLLPCTEQQRMERPFLELYKKVERGVQV